MKDLYKPENSVELSLIKSIFDSEGIHYYVLNDNFGSLHIGPQIDLFNAKMIRVNEAHYEKAKDLLSDYLTNSQSEISSDQANYTLWDKVRMVLEVALFSWFIPGKKKKITEQQEDGL